MLHTRSSLRAARLLAAVLAAAWLAGCATPGPRADGVPLVAETWISVATPADEIDSVSAWRTPEDALLVIATAKAGDRLRVYDGRDGRLLRSIGSGGEDAGRFRRPNGLFVIDGLAFVVERDNHRVQVIDLADDRSLGQFGADTLHTPYGLWVWRQASGRYKVYVTDSYYTAQREVPPDAELDARVKLFEVEVAPDGLTSRLLAAFGETVDPGVVRTVESVWGDPEHDRLLVADENPAGRNLKVYDLAGRFTGTTVGSGLFEFEPEGIALVRCQAPGEGYWVVSDQHTEQQRFLLFDRRTLAPAGAFVPATTRMVDGIWFQPDAGAPFAGAALYSQHADAAVAAFDWSAISAALDLRPGCDR
jgi:3-phytase